MTQSRAQSDGLDRKAYLEADKHITLVQNVLQPDAIQSLAQEVVRRLAFRASRDIPANAAPSIEQIDALCAALLSNEADAGYEIILDARSRGATADVIYVGYVARAARRLGVMWEEDIVSFAEVTLATSRLYRIIRALRHVIEAVALKDAKNRHVMFTLVPGDTHTLGIEMATDLFRREGWDVELSVGETHDDIVARTEFDRFQSIVIVSHTEKTIPSIISLIVALRITQPLAHIVLAGNVLLQNENIRELVGADDVITDVSASVAQMRAIISPVE